MATIERSALIAAPVDAVWSALADFAGISSWASNVDHSSFMTEQTEGVGSVRRIQTAGMTLVETVERWEPGAELSYRITGLPPVIRSVTNTWRIGASGASTMVLLTTQVEAGPRPPQLAIARVVGRRMAKASETMLAGIAAHVERGVAA